MFCNILFGILNYYRASFNFISNQSQLKPNEVIRTFNQLSESCRNGNTFLIGMERVKFDHIEQYILGNLSKEEGAKFEVLSETDKNLKAGHESV